MKICSVCATQYEKGTGCNNHRCAECHRAHCTPGGDDSPGHGLGTQTNHLPLTMGKIVGTPGALEILEQHNTLPSALLDRHRLGDWGDLCEEDREQNRISLEHGMRIMSAYTLGDDKLWVITEADRSVTTILRPEDY